jgi:hypothetical protein
MHIIFGCKNPSQRAPRLRKKGDRFYSEANYNLYAEDEQPVIALSDFIEVMDGGSVGLAARGGAWGHIREGDLSLCEGCQKANKVPCAMFLNPAASPPADASRAELVKAVAWPRWSAEPLKWCPIIERLLTMTETAAERRFYELYFKFMLSNGLRPVRYQVLLVKAYAGTLTMFESGSVPSEEPGSESWMSVTWSHLVATLDLPALIPQVVLNFVGAEGLPSDHPDKRFYESNVGRVDFMFFDKKGSHVVEIDGPYHHRTEEDYARLLRQDRRLRKEGYHVHRFGNLEVMQAKEFNAFATELFFH